MIRQTLSRHLRTGASLSAAAGLLLLGSCNKDKESEADHGAGKKSPGPGPGAPASGSPDRPAPGQHASKSGQRTGKKPAPDMIKTASGLQYQVIKQGTGPKPGPTDNVTVHYHGTLPDGTVFDSSVARAEPAKFPVNGVIKGWIEGLQLMSVGSKYKFVIPPDLAYGPSGTPDGTIGPNQTLHFEVELLSID